MGTIRSEGENFFLAEQLSVRSAKPPGPPISGAAERPLSGTAGPPISGAEQRTDRWLKYPHRPYQPDFLFTWRMPQPAAIRAAARMISVPHLTHRFAHPSHTARRRQTSPSLSKSRRSSSSDHLVSLPAPTTLAPAPSARCSAPVVRRCRYPRHLPKAKKPANFFKKAVDNYAGKQYHIAKNKNHSYFERRC